MIKKIEQITSRFICLLLLLCAASGIGFLFRYFNLPETNIAIVYLLSVLLSALLIPGPVYGCITSVLYAFAFNFFFTEPYFAISTNAPSYAITFIIMTITSLIVSTLTSRTKLSIHQLQEREMQTKALYSLTTHLTNVIDISDIASVAASTVSSVICGQSGCLCFNEKGVPETSFIQQISPQEQIWREIDNPEAIMRSIAELYSEFYIGDEFCDWPIYGSETTLGIIRLPRKSAEKLSKSQISLLHSMIESIALAMDRLYSVRQQIKLKEETEHERYRSSLLRSISHDLRTPLSVILGSTEMLLDMTAKEDNRYPIIEGIGKDAAWLNSLVENVLSLTRLQNRKQMLNKQPEAVEEILADVGNQILRRYPQYCIEMHAPEELFLVPMDARLIIQVLINLLDNAVKNTEPPGEISVIVFKDEKENQAVFSVRDNGCGLRSEDIPHIFQMFYTARDKHIDSTRGIGLGLAICDAIIKEHGGTIQAQNRADCTGAKFTFTLPLEDKSNE